MNKQPEGAVWTRKMPNGRYFSIMYDGRHWYIAPPPFNPLLAFHGGIPIAFGQSGDHPPLYQWDGPEGAKATCGDAMSANIIKTIDSTIANLAAEYAAEGPAPTPLDFTAADGVSSPRQTSTPRGAVPPRPINTQTPRHGK